MENPAITYNWSSSGEELCYAEWDGASWQIDIVFTDPFDVSQHDVSLEFDPTGNLPTGERGATLMNSATTPL